jgi:hypothetical protein
MIGQDLAILNYQYSQHYETNIENKKKQENWFSYFRKLINDSLSKRFLSSCDAENDDNNCPISLDKMINPAKTSCGHVFEKDNIIMWIREKRTCPICRKELDLN